MARNRYHNEWDRLQSYINWPVTAEAYPSSLSRAGFYYTGDSDIVSCFCCAIRVGHWLRTDLPLHEHTRHSPDCRFVLGEETGNTPIPGSPSVREIRQRETSILEARGGQKKSDRSTSADSLVCVASGKSISAKSGPSISDGTTLSRVNVYLTFRMLLYFRISSGVMLSGDNGNILIIGFSFQGTVLNVFLVFLM